MRRNEFKNAARMLGLRTRWNDGDEKKGDGDGDKINEGQTVSKTELDALQSKYDAQTKDLDEIRGEVLSDDYLSFLKSQGDDSKATEPSEIKVPEDADLAKMSKKEIFDLALNAAKQSHTKEFEVFKQGFANDKKAATKLEVERFAAGHEDFVQFRPLMYGLSTDPKNENKSLQELYNMAKVYAKGLPGTSDGQKAEQRKMWGEKPGEGSGAFDKTEIKSAVDATNDAVNEVMEKHGPLPSA